MINVDHDKMRVRIKKSPIKVHMLFMRVEN